MEHNYFFKFGIPWFIMKKKELIRNKKAMLISTVGKWVIGIAALVIIVGVLMVLFGRGSGAAEFIKNIFSFGR